METLIIYGMLAVGIALLGFTVTYGVSISGGGLSLANSITRTGDGAVLASPITLPVGETGTLTTRTDADTGEATMGDGGHGITTGMVVDVYWDGGMRYGVTVGTVDGTAVPLDGGSGDDYPSTSTALVITEQVVINVAIDGDELSILAIKADAADANSTAVGHIDFQDSSDSGIEEIDLAANVAQVWDIDGGTTNVFTGNPITHAHASCGSATEALTLHILGAVDATP